MCYEFIIRVDLPSSRQSMISKVLYEIRYHYTLELDCNHTKNGFKSEQLILMTGQGNTTSGVMG